MLESGCSGPGLIGRGTEVIPDEAVEAAAKVLALVMRGKKFEGMDEYTQAFISDTAKVALEAAAPHMMAGAWDEGAAAGLGWDENRGEDFATPNPYRKPTDA